MSPASQGALEVERYIGSCLISSTVRPSMHKDFACKKLNYPGKGYAVSGEQCQGQYGTGTWAGTPLVSMTSTPRRSNQQRSSPSPLSQQQQPVAQQQKQQCPNAPEQQLPGHLHNKSPLVRLAIHTQGAPLILTGRFHNRGGKAHNTNANPTGTCLPINNRDTGAIMPASSTKCPANQNQRKIQNQAAQNCPKEVPATNIDSLSIASDESSNNSENSLPRIIKPRKRRKKDRKPPNAILTGDVPSKQEDQQQQQQQQQQTNSASGCAINLGQEQAPVPAKGPQCYEPAAPHFRGQRRPPTMARESAYGRLHSSSSSCSLQEVVDTRQQRYAYRHVQVKVLDDNRNVIVPLPARQLKGYRPNGTNNNLQATRYHDNIAADRSEPVSCQGRFDECYGGCQCRYCDPAALIWDVDRNSYGPFLASVPYPRQVPVFLTPYTCQEQFYETPETASPGVCLHRERDPGVAVLRRSWSDPMGYCNDEIVPNRDVGVIGDRGQSELRGRTGVPWRADVSSPSSDANSPVSGSVMPSSQGLEVSTEIVTSPNGHRDLEIKFYSSSPSSTIQEEDKIGFGFPEDDGEEDFSDIWSYHESKLQQDFRTLLQAEE